MGGLCTLHFMNELSALVAKDHLLKKSVLLLKAWFTYESSLLGSQYACMANYALYTLVLHVLNNYHEELESPMNVFRKFFEVWGDFDWVGFIVSVYAPIRNFNFYDTLKEKVILSVNTQQYHFNVDAMILEERAKNPNYSSRKLLFSPSDIEELEIKYSKVRLSSASA